jgi:hypothetical protein
MYNAITGCPGRSVDLSASAQGTGNHEAGSGRPSPRRSQAMPNYNRQHAYYAGVDLHARTLFLHICDPAGHALGRFCERLRIASHWLIENSPSGSPRQAAFLLTPILMLLTTPPGVFSRPTPNVVLRH